MTLLHEKKKKKKIVWDIKVGEGSGCQQLKNIKQKGHADDKTLTNQKRTKS